LTVLGLYLLGFFETAAAIPATVLPAFLALAVKAPGRLIAPWIQFFFVAIVAPIKIPI
jgi:hypothetical protein